jgi:hypothetical protein
MATKKSHIVGTTTKVALLLLLGLSVSFAQEWVEIYSAVDYCEGPPGKYPPTEWRVNLSAIVYTGDGDPVPPQSNWVWYWYENASDGNWHNFATTYGSNNSTSLDNLIGHTGQAYVHVSCGLGNFTSGTVDVPGSECGAFRMGAFPNPFNPTTTIKFTIAQTGMTTLKVYDVMGREVATLLNESLAAGVHSIKLDGTNLSSGTYLYVLTSGGHRLTGKMLLLK